MNLKSSIVATVLAASSLSPVQVQAQSIKTEFEEMVSNCLNGPLRGSPDPTTGCSTPRKTLPDDNEKVYLNERGLGWVMQKVNGEYRLILTRKQMLNETVTVQGGGSSSRRAVQPGSTTYYPRPQNQLPSNITIHGSGEVSINGAIVFKNDR